jgi:hypothetical protein
MYKRSYRGKKIRKRFIRIYTFKRVETENKRSYRVISVEEGFNGLMELKG